MKQITLYTGGGVTFSPQYAEGRTVSSFVRLVADEGMMLTNGEVNTECVDVLSTDVGAWNEVEGEVPNPEPTDEPQTDAWDVEQGEYIPAGFLLARDGVMYECIRDHYAAWNKQPPNDEYWRTIT